MICKICIVGLLNCGMAMGQAASTPVAGAAVPAKAYAFEVVSVRQNISGDAEQFGPTPDGYRMTNMSIDVVMMTAYVPQVGGSAFYTQNQVKGFPDWAGQERYDIDARISDEDRAEWQNPASQKVMLQAMMRALLEDRCKMVVHREVKEAAVYSLVVGKKGPKFRETNPDEAHPGGEALPWGGAVVFSNSGVSLYGTSMASLASFISALANPGHPVQDKTGLTGKYDLVMKFPPPPPPPAPGEPQSTTAAPDPRGSMAFSVLNDLGLKLDSAKGQVETLVIDHMERPSEN